MKGNYKVEISCDWKPYEMDICDTFENAVKRAKAAARGMGWESTAYVLLTLHGRTVWRGVARGRGAAIREQENAVKVALPGTVEHLALFLGGERVDAVPRGAQAVVAGSVGYGLYALDGKFYIVGL